MLKNRIKLRELNKNRNDSSDNLRELVGFTKPPEGAKNFAVNVVELLIEAEMEALLTFSQDDYAPILCTASSRVLEQQYGMDNFGTSSQCINYVLNEASDDIYLAAVFYGVHLMQKSSNKLRKFAELLDSLVEDN